MTDVQAVTKMHWLPAWSELAVWTWTRTWSCLSCTLRVPKSLMEARSPTSPITLPRDMSCSPLKTQRVGNCCWFSLCVQHIDLLLGYIMCCQHTLFLYGYRYRYMCLIDAQCLLSKQMIYILFFVFVCCLTIIQCSLLLYNTVLLQWRDHKIGAFIYKIYTL